MILKGSRMSGTVQVVHCIDTEGPLHESLEATFAQLRYRDPIMSGAMSSMGTRSPGGRGGGGRSGQQLLRNGHCACALSGNGKGHEASLG